MKKIIYLFLIIFFYSTAEGQWLPNIHFDNTYGYTSYSKSIAVSNNLVHVVWHDYRFGTWEIYYKRSTDGGITWEPDKRLTNNVSQSDNPSICVNGLNVYVVWHDNSTGYFTLHPLFRTSFNLS